MSTKKLVVIGLCIAIGIAVFFVTSQKAVFGQERGSNTPSVAAPDPSSGRAMATMHLASGEKIDYDRLVIETPYAIRVVRTNGRHFTAFWGNIKYIEFN